MLPAIISQCHPKALSTDLWVGNANSLRQAQVLVNYTDLEILASARVQKESATA